MDEFDKDSGVFNITTRNNNDSRILNRTSSMGSIPVKQSDQNISVNSTKLIKKTKFDTKEKNQSSNNIMTDSKKIVINFDEAIGILHNDLLSLEI